MAAHDRISGFLASLDTEVEALGQGGWNLPLEAGGFPLNVRLTARGELLRAEAAILPPGIINPHQLLFWNRQAPFVCFAENGAGEIIVCGEFPLSGASDELLDRFLGLLVASATRAREFAIENA